MSSENVGEYSWTGFALVGFLVGICFRGGVVEATSVTLVHHWDVWCSNLTAADRRHGHKADAQ